MIQALKNTAIRKSELPFDSDRKLMSISSLNHIYTKGAPDVSFTKMFNYFN